MRTRSSRVLRPLLAVGAVLLAVVAANGPAAPSRAVGLVTGTDGSPMVLTFVAEADGDTGYVLLGEKGDPGTVNVRVDWGDTNSDDFDATGVRTHTYTNAGTYTVRIWPRFSDAGVGGSDTGPWLTVYGIIRGGASAAYSELGFAGTTPAGIAKLTSVGSFGDLGIVNLNNAFANHWDLTDVPSTLPTSVTDLSATFEGASAFDDGDISSWDVSRVTDMGDLFRDAVLFNQALTDWDVRNVTTMSATFEGATAFNGDISTWASRVSKVDTFESFLRKAENFDQDLTGWDVSGASNLDSIFEDAFAFDGDVSNWTFSSTLGIDGTGMFDAATAFNQPLSSWDVSNFDDMDSMFNNATSFNQALSTWDVSNVTGFGDMFDGATSFDQNLGGWQLADGADLYGMFNSSGMSTACYDATLVGWAALDPPVTGLELSADGVTYSTDGAAARSELVDRRTWQITGDASGGTPGGDCTIPTASSTTSAPGGSSGPAVSCTPALAGPGTEVTCEVTGGDADVEILWRAAGARVFGSRGVLLGPDGAGTFTFTVPPDAELGQASVELVGWGASTSVTVGRPVPTVVRAGGGPSGRPALPVGAPLAVALAVAAVGAPVLRRRRG